jgi:hypothetical protein
MKTSELQGPALDWAVSEIEGNGGVWYESDKEVVLFIPSTSWEHGGPIIERERIGVEPWGTDKTWLAQTYNEAGRILQRQYGPTPLIAAMRCYVASKLGDEVEIPEELK